MVLARNFRIGDSITLTPDACAEIDETMSTAERIAWETAVVYCLRQVGPLARIHLTPGSVTLHTLPGRLASRALPLEMLPGWLMGMADGRALFTDHPEEMIGY